MLVYPEDVRVGHMRAVKLVEGSDGAKYVVRSIIESRDGKKREVGGPLLFVYTVGHEDKHNTMFHMPILPDVPTAEGSFLYMPCVNDCRDEIELFVGSVMGTLAAVRGNEAVLAVPCIKLPFERYMCYEGPPPSSFLLRNLSAAGRWRGLWAPPAGRVTFKFIDPKSNSETGITVRESFTGFFLPNIVPVMNVLSKLLTMDILMFATLSLRDKLMIRGGYVFGNGKQGSLVVPRVPEDEYFSGSTWKLNDKIVGAYATSKASMNVPLFVTDETLQVGTGKLIGVNSRGKKVSVPMGAAYPLVDIFDGARYDAEVAGIIGAMDIPSKTFLISGDGSVHALEDAIREGVLEACSKYLGAISISVPYADGRPVDGYVSVNISPVICVNENLGRYEDMDIMLVGTNGINIIVKGTIPDDGNKALEIARKATKHVNPLDLFTRSILNVSLSEFIYINSTKIDGVLERYIKALSTIYEIKDPVPGWGKEIRTIPANFIADIKERFRELFGKCVVFNVSSTATYLWVSLYKFFPCETESKTKVLVPLPASVIIWPGTVYGYFGNSSTICRVGEGEDFLREIERCMKDEIIPFFREKISLSDGKTVRPNLKAGGTDRLSIEPSVFLGEKIAVYPNMAHPINNNIGSSPSLLTSNEAGEVYYGGKYYGFVPDYSENVGELFFLGDEADAHKLVPVSYQVSELKRNEMHVEWILRGIPPGTNVMFGCGPHGNEDSCTVYVPVSTIDGWIWLYPVKEGDGKARNLVELISGTLGMVPALMKNGRVAEYVGSGKEFSRAKARALRRLLRS